ncbi:MAG: EAL domain-containing protein, partial [Gammaproteobacteria bacterium]|nr:EAL domain-containing protein [Gammaproteobacteria bacterium]
HPAQALQSRRTLEPGERIRCWPVFSNGTSLSGAFVLARAADQKPLGERSCKTASFIASTIEHLLEKAFDPVTGLSTWPHFEIALENAREAEAVNASIMYLDMDRMSLLNDTLSRQAGDKLLGEFGAILRQVLGKQAITRVTSDSFAALLLNTSLDEAIANGQEICKRVQAIEIDNGEEQSFKPSVSIGVAEFDESNGAAGSLLVQAQVACQAAKDRGRGRIEVYIDADKSIVQRMDDLNQVGSIRSAIEGGRLVLFAQPIYSTHGEQDGAYHELLVRMLDTTGEPVPPADFMGAAERYQLMQELDRWVVTKAIETLTDEPNDLNGKPLRFAVNLSGQSIGSDKFLDFIKQEFARTGLDPRRICLEITETVAVSNLKKAQVFMNELSALGCQFSLDDFGTGLSSFAYLKMFPVQKLKIDGSFVTDVCENEVSRSMVSAIAEIARVMGIETVAEYVQSQAIYTTVKELGVDWAQGYHVGEPTRLRDLFDNPTIIDKADLADVDPTVINKLPA